MSQEERDDDYAGYVAQIQEKDFEIKRLREALTEILEYPEERASYAIAEKALEGGV